MAKILTYDMLYAAGACGEQRSAFRKFFGESVEVTRELAIQHARDFDFDFAADHFLSRPAREAYWGTERAAYNKLKAAIAGPLKICNNAGDNARDKYDAAVKVAREALYAVINGSHTSNHEAAYDAAYARYNEDTGPAYAEYRRVCDAARAVYVDATEGFRLVYEQERAAAWADAFLSMPDVETPTNIAD